MKLTPDGAQKLIHSLGEERKQLIDQINIKIICAVDKV